ncbi:hypothetical protein GCM10022378_00090 [Salinicoccus jeotgali]|uniref:Uncharacterized protein n=1 Tax=Salinicoccus jeotgali TaxID=381634 RepID=A0ABP7E476_9STAP
MDKYKTITLMISIILLASCSKAIPYGYSEDDIEKIKEESYSYFPLSLKNINDTSDVAVDKICEVNTETLTTNNYEHVFIAQLDEETLNVGLNKETNEVNILGDFSNTEQCKTL